MSDYLHDMVAKARDAQAAVEDWTQEQVDEMVAAVGWAVYRREHAEACARSAVEETAMGIYEHKLLKHQKKTLGTLRDLHGVRSVGIIEEDEARGLIKFAKPVGVVGALTPVTNCSSTICCNGLSILKGRNAVIFAPHPSAKRTAELTCGYMRAALRTVDAPEGLVQNVAEPTIEGTKALMQLVDVVVATGGAAMVKSAYSSGTPSFGVGAGNAVGIVDETADPGDAARKIAASKTFDNATSCSSENSVVVHETSPMELSACVRTFLDSQGISQAVIGGNSLGDHVALELALAYPDRVSGLILTGSSGLFERSFTQGVPHRPDSRWVREKMQEIFFDPAMVTAEWVESVQRLLSARDSVLRLLQTARATKRRNIEAHLPAIRVPTCLIWGEDDRITPLEVAWRFHALIPRSNLFLLPRCGHAPMLEQPEAFNTILADWLWRTREERRETALAVEVAR